MPEFTLLDHTHSQSSFATDEVISILKQIIEDTESWEALSYAWRSDAWPSGWHPTLEHIFQHIESDDIAELTETFNDLPPLLQGTCTSALLRMGKLQRAPDGMLPVMAEHCVRQIEFDGSDVKRFFRWELDALQKAWPEEWQHALLKAASTVENMCFDVWPTVRDHLVPHASAEQLVEIACRHSHIRAEEGQEVFGLDRALELIRSRAAEAFAVLSEKLDNLDNGTIERSTLRMLTFGLAECCLANGNPYPSDKAQIWQVCLNIEQTLAHTEMMLPYIPLLPFAGFAQWAPIDWIQTLKNPATGDSISFNQYNSAVAVSHNGPNNNQSSTYTYDNDEDAEQAMRSMVFEKIGEGFVHPSGMIELAPTLTRVSPWKEGVEWLTWHPDGRECLLKANGKLQRLSSDMQHLSTITLRDCNAASYSPNGEYLALATPWKLCIVETSSGNALSTHGIDHHRLSFAWCDAQDPPYLHVLGHQEELTSIDLHQHKITARTKLNSVNDALGTTANGKIIVANGGHASQLLTDEHKRIAIGLKTGATTTAVIPGSPPAILWAENCQDIFWQSIDQEENSFANTVSHFRLSFPNTDNDAEYNNNILFYEYVGSSPDGRLIFIGGGSENAYYVGIIDRKIACVLAILALEERVCGSCVSPNRQWLYLWDMAEQCYRIDLRDAMLEGAPKHCTFLIRLNAPQNVADPSFVEANGFPPQELAILSQEERKDVAQWLGEGIQKPAYPKWSKTKWPKATQDSVHQTSLSEVQKQFGFLDALELMKQYVDASPQQRTQLRTKVQDLLAESQEFCERALKQDAKEQYLRAIRILQHLGERVFVPFVEIDGEIDKANTSEPFPTNARLVEAYEPYDSWDNVLNDPEYHNLDNARAVLDWAGFGPEALAKMAERVEQIEVKDLPTLLFPPDIRTDWQLDAYFPPPYLQDRYLDIAYILDFLEGIELRFEQDDFHRYAALPERQREIEDAYERHSAHQTIGPIIRGIEFFTEEYMHGVFQAILRYRNSPQQKYLNALQETLQKAETTDAELRAFLEEIGEYELLENYFAQEQVEENDAIVDIPEGKVDDPAYLAMLLERLEKAEDNKVVQKIAEHLIAHCSHYYCGDNVWQVLTFLARDLIERAASSSEIGPLIKAMETLYDHFTYPTRRYFGYEFPDEADKKWAYQALGIKACLEALIPNKSTHMMRTLLVLELAREHHEEEIHEALLQRSDYQMWRDQRYGLYPWRIDDRGKMRLLLPTEPEGRRRSYRFEVGATMQIDIGGTALICQKGEVSLPHDPTADTRVFYYDDIDKDLLIDGWQSSHKLPDEAFVHYLTRERKESLENEINEWLDDIVQNFETFDMGALNNTHVTRNIMTTYQPGVFAINESWLDAFQTQLHANSNGEIGCKVEIQATDDDPFYTEKRAVLFTFTKGSESRRILSFPHGITMLMD